jgi:hypothetical protein
MAGVFQNSDPPSPSPPGECVPPAFGAGGRLQDTLAGWRGGWGGGQYFGRRQTQLCTPRMYVSTLRVYRT